MLELLLLEAWLLLQLRTSLQLEGRPQSLLLLLMLLLRLLQWRRRSLLLLQ